LYLYNSLYFNTIIFSNVHNVWPGKVDIINYLPLAKDTFVKILLKIL